MGGLCEDIHQCRIASSLSKLTSQVIDDNLDLSRRIRTSMNDALKIRRSRQDCRYHRMAYVSRIIGLVRGTVRVLADQHYDVQSLGHHRLWRLRRAGHVAYRHRDCSSTNEQHLLSLLWTNGTSEPKIVGGHVGCAF